MKRASLVLLIAAAASCGPSALVRDEKSCEGVRAAKTFLTYNTAWAPGMVTMASLRAPLVIESLQSADFDVACLQEIWSPAHAQQIKDALGLQSSQVFYDDTTDLRESGNDVCTDSQLQGLAACAIKECGAVQATEEVTICMRAKCGNALYAVYNETGGHACANCLIASAGKSIDDIRARCTSDGATRIQDGASSAMLVAKDGRLYSKEPMLLPSSGSNRTALFATVRMADPDGQAREIEVACTHISATAEIPPSETVFATWDEERQAQIALITARLAERALRADGTAVPMVLMGDFNTSAGSSPVWADLKDAGYVCPTADPVTGGGCSSCDSNSLRSNADGSVKGTAIDHVCYFNPPGSAVALAPVCTDRLFDRKMRVKSYDGVSDIVTHPSDHYAKRSLFDLIIAAHTAPPAP